MSLERCIPGLVADGSLTPEEGAEALKLYGRRKRFHGRSMAPSAAEALATEEAAAAVEIAAARKARLAVLQVDGQKRAIADMAAFRGEHAGDAAIALLVHDEKAPYSNFEYRWKAVKGAAERRLDGLLMHFKHDLAGRIRNKADLDLVLLELKGRDSGDLGAREFAKAFADTAEELRQWRNSAGGNVGKIEHWTPQNHDSVSIREAGMSAWRAFVLGETEGRVPILERDKMKDWDSGQQIDDERLFQILGEVHETLASDGWIDRKPGSMGGRSLANMNAEHRFLHFTPEGWIAYNERFGRGTLFDAMMAHIDRESRDIALMERLGPNPAATIKWLQDSLAKRAALDGGRGKKRLFGLRPGRLATDQARIDANIVGQIFDEATGKHRVPHNRELAIGFSIIRNWQVATKLGGAVLSTTSDQATQALTRGFNGMPVADIMRTQLKMLNPLDDADQRFAIRSSLTSEGLSQMTSSATSRFMGEVTGEVSRRMASAVLRASGLDAVTRGGRWAYGMDSFSWMTHERERAFDQLDPAFRRYLDRYGFDGADWDRIRATPLQAEQGSEWILPHNIANRELRMRLAEATLTEVDHAVPVPGLRLQAAINSRAKSGTWAGELLKTGFQFKAFPVTVMMMQGRRAMALEGWRGRAGYAASMAVLMTAAGALAVWMKDISKGRDPRKADGQFLLEAFAQGGGGGIYGDFVRSSQDRFGSGFEETLKGPAWRTGATIEDLTLGAIGDARRGQRVNYGRRVVKALGSELPGSSLWYTRLLFEREMLDTMQQQIDPHYRDAWRRTAQAARHDYGQGFWWNHGDALPERAPDLSVPVEGAAQ